mmetsp:Transcript_32082/g.78140  ORF Transcript_32082/g.78140 Transcript_32082/m.78140 type:complete len:732 (+) Transcript_32082:86-2281(+)
MKNSMASSQVPRRCRWCRSMGVTIVLLVLVMMMTTTTTVPHNRAQNVGFGAVSGAVVKSFPPQTPTFSNSPGGGSSSWKTAFGENEKHPLEDAKSWKLHAERRNKQKKLQDEEQRQKKQSRFSLFSRDNEDDGRRRLATYVKVATDERTPYTVLHKQLKPHLPFAGGDTTHGMMIDAGSQGTRLHIYEWDQRILLDQDDLLETVHGRKLSIPTSNSRWTDKYLPGLDVFATYKNETKLVHHLRKYLGPLLEFAKTVLQDKEDQWSSYPIYLKATGGLRTLPQHDRVRIMDAVRTLFNDHETFNPFAFKDEQARVISGEEEAIYGWVGVNFALDTLIKDSEKHLFVDPKLTYGMVEMGGASTQIAFFENSQDLMANLFKLQLGATRHWNVYVHSYLYVGINGAFSRLNGRLYGKGTNVNPCLPVGSEIDVESWIHMNEFGRFYPRSANESTSYNTTMVSRTATMDVEECSDRTYRLLRKDANEEWCDFEMDGNCAFAGIYQPPMPKVTDKTTEFIATSNFVDVFQFLGLGERANVSEIGEGAREVCKLTWKELKKYDEKLEEQHDEDTLKQMCFRSLFVYHLLAEGWGFGDDYTLNAVDVINGQKLGWALGCMLYEINTLPWDFHPELLYKGRSWWQIVVYVILGIAGGGTIGFVLAMNLNKSFNKKVRESKFFRHSILATNPVIRKSLSVRDLDLSDLDRLYDDDELDAEREAFKKKNETYESTGSSSSRF